LKHVAQTHTRPAGVPNAAKTPLRTRYRGAVEAAAVAGALEDADQLGARKSFQIGKSQSQRAVHQAIDCELPAAFLHFRNVGVAADEEAIDRSDLVDEFVDRHFEIGGAR